MKLPPNKTEKEVLEDIEKVVHILAPGFVFGYYSLDDILQFGRLKALECLDKYDGVRSLAAFLYRHVKNRYINLKRDELSRVDCPCKKCLNGENCTGTKEVCKTFYEWKKRNSTKANLIRPLDFGSLPEECSIDNDSEFVCGLEKREILNIIDEKLPFRFRETYLKMLSGVNVPKAKKLQVEQEIKNIFNNYKEDE